METSEPQPAVNPDAAERIKAAFARQGRNNHGGPIGTNEGMHQPNVLNPESIPRPTTDTIDPTVAVAPIEVDHSQAVVAGIAGVAEMARPEG